MEIFSRVSLFYTVSVVLILVVELILAILVLRRDKESLSNKLFFLFSLSMASFLITNYLADALTNQDVVTWVLRIYFMNTSVMMSSIMYFALIFPKNLHAPKWISRGLIIYGVVTGVISLTPLMVESARVRDHGSDTIGGPAFYPSVLFSLLLMIAFFVLLYISYKRSHGLARSQVTFLFLGFFGFFFTNLIVNIIYPIITNTDTLAKFGSYASAFFVGFTAYAIVATHLFDIRVIIKRTVVFTTLVAFVFGAYSVILYLMTTIFQLENQKFFTANLYINLVTTLVVGYSFQPIRTWIQDRTDQWLFKKEYEQQTVLREIGQKLNNVVGLDEAIEEVMQTISHVLHVKYAITYVFQPAENNSFAIKRVKQMGYGSSARLILEDKDFTVNYFTQHPTLLRIEEFRDELEHEADLIKKKRAKSEMIREHAIKQTVLAKLESLKVNIAIPLHLNNQPIGLIFLSEKLSGEEYSGEDLALLEMIGAQAISSIQKAKLYEGDQMKSEFVSIASHELLTPISAIEGYLSMILEENIGKVDDQARDYLNKVYTSAKRLSLLIKDLLSVSRIESGKMKIEPQQLDMAKMITDTLDQLKFVAADKKLSMVFDPPAKPLPPVWADPDRTMQVMVNLVSNAIKYTPAGAVHIAAEHIPHDNKVSVSVSDTGIGMSKDQMSHLFTKFYRVDSAQTSGIMGTGLGLYITKSIVERMGGTIICKSTPGKGTIFTFSLPIFKVESSKVE